MGASVKVSFRSQTFVNVVAPGIGALIVALIESLAPLQTTESPGCACCSVRT